MSNPFVENPIEFLKLKTLIEVKKKRMPKEQAINEAIQQRYGKKELSMSYIDDCYVASNILYKKYKWFRYLSNQITIALQKDKKSKGIK